MAPQGQVKVSIIIPVYNVGSYLRKCLDSLRMQTLKEIELIVIDDGSADDSGKIADEYAAIDRRLRVVHQENQGLSAARNRGIGMARGEYTAFVDSDDWVSQDLYKKLSECADNTCADVVLGGIVYYKDAKNFSRAGVYESVFKENAVLKGKDCLIKLMETGSYLPMVCMNLYRTEFLKVNRLCFKYLYHEDEYFTPYILYYAGRVADSGEAGYYYRLREGSIMHSADRLVRADCYIGIANELFGFVEPLLETEEPKVLWALLYRALILYRDAIKILYFLGKEKTGVRNFRLMKGYKLGLWKSYFPAGEFKSLEGIYYHSMNLERKFLLEI